jgi:hypothetical protein
MIADGGPVGEASDNSHDETLATDSTRRRARASFEEDCEAQYKRYFPLQHGWAASSSRTGSEALRGLLARPSDSAPELLRRTMPIATRRLRFRSPAGEVEIPIRVFGPKRHDDGAWSCAYEIGWPHGTWTSAGSGVDSVQAILLTLQKIGIEIYTSEYHASGKLMWEAPGRGYGFPVPPNARDLLIGDDVISDA